MEGTTLVGDLVLLAEQGRQGGDVALQCDPGILLLLPLGHSCDMGVSVSLSTTTARGAGVTRAQQIRDKRELHRELDYTA